MQQLSIVQDYLLKALLHHRVVGPLGESGTVWAGVDFTRDVGVLSDGHDVVRDLYEALEDWLLISLRNGETVPTVDGIDLNAESGRNLLAWHQTHRREIDPDQSWFCTPEWQTGEREVSRELQAGEGEGTTFESGEALSTTLDDNRLGKRLRSTACVPIRRQMTCARPSFMGRPY